MTILVVSLVLILLTALYVGAEFATVRARRTRIEQLADEGSAAAADLLAIVKHPASLDEYIAACQVGITVTSLGLGFYGQEAIAPHLVPPLAALLGGASERTLVTTSALVVLVVLTVVQIILGELVPKSVAIRYPEHLALALATPMAVSTRLFRPLILLFNGSATLLVRLMGVQVASGHSHLHSPEEIELLVAESSRGGEIDPVERQMLHQAFELSQRVARQVMIPRNRLDLAPADQPVADLLAHLARSPYSRIPVYDQTPDQILGIVHLKDLFRLAMAGETSVSSVVRTVPFVPESKPVGELWQLLNQQQSYLAVVVDEFGGTAGIVTQEDLLEEVIGEVRDEFDVEPEPILYRPSHPPLLRGDLLVAAINDTFGLDLPTEESDTLGGLVMEKLGRVATRGDEVSIGDVRLRVVAVRGNGIRRVELLEPVATLVDAASIDTPSPSESDRPS